jgi:hypothetical protein
MQHLALDARPRQGDGLVKAFRWPGTAEDSLGGESMNASTITEVFQYYCRFCHRAIPANESRYRHEVKCPENPVNATEIDFRTTKKSQEKPLVYSTFSTKSVAIDIELRRKIDRYTPSLFTGCSEFIRFALLDWTLNPCANGESLDGEIQEKYSNISISISNDIWSMIKKIGGNKSAIVRGVARRYFTKLESSKTIKWLKE